MTVPGKQASRWGSFLQQAVAGIESNLDNILSGDDVPQPKPAPAVVAAPKAESIPPRSSTASPTNDRLQERLARAVAAKKYASQKNGTQTPTSNVPSRVGSPVTVSESPRQSLDVVARGSEESARESQAVTSTKDTTIPQVNIEGPNTEDILPPEVKAESPTNGLTTSTKTDTAVRLSLDSVSSSHTRPSTESVQSAAESKAASKLSESSIQAADEPATREQQILADADREEEIHGYIERIDALQAKLQYLAKESAESARKAATAAPSGSFEKKLAEKDEQIALLMEEGQKLSNTELKHMAAIRKLVAKASQSEKDATEAGKRLERVEREKTMINERLKRAEAVEKQSNERQKQVTQLQKDFEAIRIERDSKDTLIAQLKAQLAESVSQAKADEIKNIQSLLDAEKRRVNDLEEEVSSTKIEKELAEERSKVHINELKAKAEREAEQGRVVEVELKGEIQMLESRLEIMRTRAEEVSSGATGDAQAKLLRQIETLQTQYAVASENWQGIETSLTSRVAALQTERDEALRRESNIRKKAREMTLKAKSNEDEVESFHAKISDLQQELALQKTKLEKLQKRADEAESALKEAHRAFEQEKQGWTAEMQQRIEEERNKCTEEPLRSPFSSYERAVSPVASSRRGLTAEFLSLQNLQTRRASTRSILDDLPSGERRMSRPSSSRIPQSSGHGTPKRQDSTTLLSPNGDAPDMPFITMDHDDYFDNTVSTSEHHHTVNDIISVSTVGAGPSVQLVERMSAAVRRLENEKVSTKEELARLASQRDEARAEILSLMQEVEAKRSDHSRVLELEKEVADINARYQTTLEMLGEKSELVEELRADVQDVKAMYRDLVLERTVK